MTVLFRKEKQALSAVSKEFSSVICTVFLVVLWGFVSPAEAQNMTFESGSNTSFSLKISSITPAAGVSLALSSKSEVRILGFVTTYSNLSDHDNQLFLDFSYLRYKPCSSD
ncbi:hypothetical protein [Fodinibius sp.]|uniref:hypothetical protein n=1 Tax=Fodinibius sp. TaxID=1872440 RepID=UPI002ACEE5D5|nr:hypothetical protein [Fodinibius sp.]MDZ7658932.1 hypothetical protein [Fodinibius sp.]